MNQPLFFAGSYLVIKPVEIQAVLDSMNNKYLNVLFLLTLNR